MRYALLLVLLLVIAACENSVPKDSLPVKEPSKEAPVDVPAKPIKESSKILAADECSGTDADSCYFKRGVNAAITVSTCLESNTRCAKDRDYASCVGKSDSFGCRVNKTQDIASCDNIKDTRSKDACLLPLSFAYDDIDLCKSIQDKDTKEICVYGFVDRHIDCVATNFPCRTTHVLTSGDCVFQNDSYQSMCKGIADKDKDLCYKSSLPGACDLVFMPTFGYEYNGESFSRLFESPFLGDALAWIKSNTPKDSTLLADWSYGHLIRAKAQRKALVYNPPDVDAFKPGDDDAKLIFKVGSYEVKDKPYYDTKSLGELSNPDDSRLVASVMLANDSMTASSELKAKGISYIFTTVNDVDSKPLYAAIVPYDGQQVLVDQMNALAQLNGFSLVYNDSVSAVYKVD